MGTQLQPGEFVFGRAPGARGPWRYARRDGLRTGDDAEDCHKTGDRKTGTSGARFCKGRYGLVHDAGRNGSRLKRPTWTRRGGCVPYRGARRVAIANLQYLMIDGHNLLIAKLAGHRRRRVLRLPPSRAMATRRSRHRWSGHVVGLSHQGPMRQGGSEAARRAYRRTRTHLIRHAGWKHRTQGKIEPRTGGLAVLLGCTRRHGSFPSLK